MMVRLDEGMEREELTDHVGKITKMTAATKEEFSRLVYQFWYAKD